MGFTGSPSATTVDGYEAVTDGNTTYVAATNVTSAGTIYPNIYAISYTENAQSESEEIFGQILDNWSFNANTDVVSDINLCEASVTTDDYYCMDVDVSNPCGSLADTSCGSGESCVEVDGEYFCATEGEEDCQPTQGCTISRAETCAVVAQTVSTSYVVDDAGEFVSCNWDGDCSAYSTSVTGVDSVAVCDAEKGKLTRDLTRLEDLTVMAGLLDSYGEANGLCSVTTNLTCTSDDSCPGDETCEPAVPKLADGTFVSSYSTSTWPSWVSGLGNALGMSLPNDPVNEFSSCENTCDATTLTCTLTSDACATDADCGSFESATCWNSVAATFACPDESHVYGYRSVGGLSFELSAELEYDSGIWAYAIDTSDLGDISAEYDHPSSGDPVPSGFSESEAFCAGGIIGTSAICGDGVRGDGEFCEIGETDTIGCTDASSVAGTMVVTCLDTCAAFQTEAQAETAHAVCTPYSCGNGVVESGEDCDDGSANGSYGHCGDDCKTDSAFYCGDGYLAGGEQCDCGTTTNYASLVADGVSWTDLYNCTTSNGQYVTSPTGSCAYDCTSPGPSCGDGEINGGEICDGDHEAYAGNICDDGTECTTDDDCETGSCGATYAACGSGTVCNGASDAGEACTTGSNCDTGVCTAGLCTDDTDQGTPCDDIDPTDAVVEPYADNSGFCQVSCGSVVYDLTRTRNCSVTSCTWGTDGGWSDCASPDYCGNGTVDGTEECDDGNADNTDACTTSCKENVCGDAYVYSGVESCDDGSEGNGDSCDASYESTCHYCTPSCQYKTRSGAYCGDGSINGLEFCDGSDMPYYCYDTGLDDQGNVIGKGGTCDRSDVGESTTAGCETGSTCHDLGICNGGSENGEYCTLDAYATDANSTCTDGTCVAPTCSADCGSSCPFSYEVVSVLGTTEESGASASDSISLYSFENDEGDFPDNASLSLPACTVGTRITGDVDTTNVVEPTVAVYFLTDYSNTMGADENGCFSTNLDDSGDACTFTGTTRMEIVGAATTSAISALFGAVSSDSLEVGLMRVGTYLAADGSDGDGYEIDTELGSTGSNDENELITSVEDYVTAYSDGHSGGPSVYNGMKHAIDMLALATADVKAIILLSDGQICYDKTINYGSYDTSGTSCLGSGSYTCTSTDTSDPTLFCAVKELDMGLLNDCNADGITTAAVRGEGDVLVYTAAIQNSPSAEWANYMAHVSSETCGTAYDTYGDCTTGTYAFTGYSEEEISAMYDSIIESILGVTVGLTTDSTVTTGTVSSGHNRELPFPTNFACTGEPMDIPLTVTFNGSGSMTMSNMNFTYCPVQ